MTCISLVSFALILFIVSHASQVFGGSCLQIKRMVDDAEWDTNLINNADFDALLPLYAVMGVSMPPGAQPVTGPSCNP